MTITDVHSYDHAHQLSINLTGDDWTVMDDTDTSFQQCSGQWKPAHHGVFHGAHALLLVSFLIPASTHRTLAFMHLMLVAGKNCLLVTYGALHSKAHIPLVYPVEDLVEDPSFQPAVRQVRAGLRPAHELVERKAGFRLVRSVLVGPCGSSTR